MTFLIPTPAPTPSKETTNPKAAPMIHPTAHLSRAHNDAQAAAATPAPMTIAEALVLMRAAQPTNSISVTVSVWDHLHTGPGQDPAQYQAWDGTRHFAAATLHEAVGLFLIHHSALAAQDPDTAI